MSLTSESSTSLASSEVVPTVPAKRASRAKAKAEVVPLPASVSAAAVDSPVVSKPLYSPMTDVGVAAKPAGKSTGRKQFDDGYDIGVERAALADLIRSDTPDTTDPRWGRYIELLGREEVLKRRSTVNKLRQQAEPIVTDAEAAKMKSIGGLENDSDDVMMLHTKEALRLFMGRMADDDKVRHGAASGKRIGAVLRLLWLLTASDNPYADWCLVQVESKVVELRQKLASIVSAHESVLTALAKRNLHYVVQVSSKPASLRLGFRSPYGYLIADLIVDFDYMVRINKTLVAKGRLTRAEGRTQIYDAFRLLRSFFEQMIPYQRVLQTPELAGLCRGDWASSAEVAKQRVKYVVEVLGVCPRNVFAGELVPNHTRRNGDSVSEAELRLLNSVDLNGAELAAVDGDESALV